MASQKDMRWTIMQTAIEANKAAIMAVREAEIPVNNTRSLQTVLRMGGPTLNYPSFDQKT